MRYISIRDNIWETKAMKVPKDLGDLIQLNVFEGKKGEERLVAIYKLEKIFGDNS